MDLYQLKYFLETARLLSFTKAAERLHVSPSAVSRSVALLERSTGRRLFARSRRQVALTSHGEALKARAERVFDEVERAERELAGAEAAPERLRAGSREMITNYLLPGPLAEYRRRGAETRFEIYDLEPAVLAAELKRDRLDLAFYYADLADPELEARFLGRLRSHVYASRRYLREHGSGPLLSHGFIAPRSWGQDSGAPRADGFPDRRLKRRIVYEAESLEAHRRFVLDGVCVGVLPDLVMRGSGAVRLQSPPIHREIWAFTRRGRPVPKAVEGLLALVRSAARAAA